MYVDITSDMKILLELLEALDIDLLNSTPRDERNLKSIKETAKCVQTNDKILRESLGVMKKSKEKLPLEVTAAMKLVPKLLRYCGLCSGVCGGEEHFIHKTETIVEGKRVKYRVYGVSQTKGHQMIELSVLQRRELGERATESSKDVLDRLNLHTSHR